MYIERDTPSWTNYRKSGLLTEMIMELNTAILL